MATAQVCRSDSESTVRNVVRMFESSSVTRPAATSENSSDACSSSSTERHHVDLNGVTQDEEEEMQMTLVESSRKRKKPTDSPVQQIGKKPASFSANCDTNNAYDDDVDDDDDVDKIVKRVNESMSTSSSENNNEHIVYVKAKSGDLTALNPATVRKELIDQFSTMIKIEKSGKSLRIYCTSATQKTKFLKYCKIVAGLSVEATEPRKPARRAATVSEKAVWTRVVVLGVPQDMTEDVKLASGAGSAMRITKWREGVRTETTAVILSYANGTDVPEKFSVDYLTFKTRPYVPEPMRCHKCQKFGHKVTNCHAKTDICPRCGGDHNFDACPNRESRKCANCGGAHSAASKSCTKYTEVKETLRVSAVNRISYRDALIKVRQQKQETPCESTSSQHAEEAATVASDAHAGRSHEAPLNNTTHAYTTRSNGRVGPQRSGKTADRDNAALTVDYYGATMPHSSTQTLHMTRLNTEVNPTADQSRKLDEVTNRTAVHATTHTTSTGAETAPQGMGMDAAVNTDSFEADDATTASQSSISLEKFTEFIAKLSVLLTTTINKSDMAAEMLKLAREMAKVPKDLFMIKVNEIQAQQRK